MPERVLITGGAGFIGSHTLDRLLQHGFDVRVLDRLHPQVHAGGVTPSYLPSDVELIRGDVRDLGATRRAVRGVSHVFHLAAETSVGQSMYQGDVHVDVNARGTAMLFRAIREERVDVGRVILSSSRAVYGEGAYRCDGCGRSTNPGQRAGVDLEVGLWTPRCSRCGLRLRPIPTDEDVEMRYSSSYGMTKSFQEQIARLEAAQLGISLVTLRYFNVYGSRQSPHNPYTGLITTLSLRLLAHKPLVLYECGSPVRDFVHVDDVVWSNVRAVSADLGAECTLNIGSGHALTLSQLAVELGCAFGDEVRVEFSERFRVGDIHASIADIERARQLLGYEPSVPIEVGLRGLMPELEERQGEDRSDAVESELREKGILRGV